MGPDGRNPEVVPRNGHRPIDAFDWLSTPPLDAKTASYPRKEK
jgi:hypothetical protein